MFEKILVPVDGSETSWKAMEEAKKLAEAFRGENGCCQMSFNPINKCCTLGCALRSGHHQPR